MVLHVHDTQYYLFPHDDLDDIRSRGSWVCGKTNKEHCTSIKNQNTANFAVGID